MFSFSPETTNKDLQKITSKHGNINKMDGIDWAYIQIHLPIPLDFNITISRFFSTYLMKLP